MLGSTKSMIKGPIVMLFMFGITPFTGKYFPYMMLGTIVLMVILIVSYLAEKKDESIVLDIISMLAKKSKVININDIIEEMYRDGRGSTVDSPENVYRHYKKKGVIPFDVEVLSPADYELRMASD